MKYKLRGVFSGWAVVLQVRSDIFEVCAHVIKDVCGDTIGDPEQTHQNMLGPDILVLKCPGLFDGILNYLFGPGRLWQLAVRNRLGAGLD